MASRPKLDIPTVQVSYRLREDEIEILQEACERLGMKPGRLLGRLIRAMNDPLVDVLLRGLPE